MKKVKLKSEPQKLDKEEYFYLYLDTDSFEGDIEEIVKTLRNIPQKLKESHAGFRESKYTWKRFEIKWEYDYDDNKEPRVYAIRDETDEEFNKRIEASKKASENAKKAAQTKKLAQEKRERTLFETLKKKYG